MSFSNLWDCFSKVTNYRAETKRLLEEAAAFMNEKAELDKQYARGLEKLSNSELFNFLQFSKPLHSLRSLILSQAESLNRHAEISVLDLAYSIKRLLLSQESAIKDKKETAKKLLSDQKRTEKAYHKSKDKFHKQRREEVRRRNTVKVEESYRESYRNSIGELNETNNIFLPNMKKILMFYQKQEEDKMSLLKEKLSLFLSDNLKCTVMIEEKLNSILSAMNEVKAFADIQKFIKKETTGKTLNKVHFEDISDEITEDLKDDLEIFVEHCWKGERLKSEDFIKFSDLISEYEGRLTWTNLVNKKRIEGNFVVPGDSYSDLCCLTNLLLDQMVLCNDYRCALTIILLSQTFFTENAGDKVFLQQLVKEHSIWKVENIWHDLTLLAIENEIDAFAKHCLNGRDIQEDLPKQLQEIVSSQLFSITYIMQECEVPVEGIRELIAYFEEKYTLPGKSLPTNFN